MLFKKRVDKFKISFVVFIGMWKGNKGRDEFEIFIFWKSFYNVKKW